MQACSATLCNNAALCNSENVFNDIPPLPAVLEELVNTGRLKGSVVGGRQDKAVYIPDIYSKTQNTWVDSFLQQNGYLGKRFRNIIIVIMMTLNSNFISDSQGVHINISITSCFLFFSFEPFFLQKWVKATVNIIFDVRSVLF